MTEHLPDNLRTLAEVSTKIPPRKSEGLTICAVQMYHTYPPSTSSTNGTNAIIYVSDIYGVPLLQNKLYIIRTLTEVLRTNIIAALPTLSPGRTTQS